jgi:glycine dehydrogenase subunit 2
MMTKPKLRRYHAPVWDEPLVMEMGVSGRRGCHFPEAEDDVRHAVGGARDLVPAAMRRRTQPNLPEMSEPDVLRHYLHLSQQTLGMMGISLFGTCTMKYNPRLTEGLTARPQIADLHPQQDPDTLQGALEIRAFGYGPVCVPARWRRGCRVHDGVHHSRFPRRTR